MAKLFYRYGVMGSAKSSNLIQAAYNYTEHNKEVLVFTSGLDDRYGLGKVTSRIGLEKDAVIIPPNDTSVLLSYFDKIIPDKIAAVFVDECQFLSEEQVDILAEIVDTYDIPVMCYGIRTDFNSKLFTGSARLFEIADKIEELVNVCECGKKALFNARLVSSTEKVFIGGNESYKGMCRVCYKKHIGK